MNPQHGERVNECVSLKIETKAHCRNTLTRCQQTFSHCRYRNKDNRKPWLSASSYCINTLQVNQYESLRETYITSSSCATIAKIKSSLNDNKNVFAYSRSSRSPRIPLLRDSVCVSSPCRFGRSLEACISIIPEDSRRRRSRARARAQQRHFRREEYRRSSPRGERGETVWPRDDGSTHTCVSDTATGEAIVAASRVAFSSM